jgi:hypothetical protein
MVLRNRGLVGDMLLEELSTEGGMTKGVPLILLHLDRLMKNIFNGMVHHSIILSFKFMI